MSSLRTWDNRSFYGKRISLPFFQNKNSKKKFESQMFVTHGGDRFQIEKKTHLSPAEESN